MAETDFFFDSVDERSLISFILQQGGRLVADRQFSPQLQYIDCITDYIDARNERSLFFVLFESSFECPLELIHVTEGHYAGKYFVRQRVGGPTIDFSACNQRSKDGRERISDGSISYFSTYENTITGEMERTPDTLIRQFRLIVNEAKKGSTIISGNSGRKYIVGPHTSRMILDGNLEIAVEGLSLPTENEDHT